MVKQIISHILGRSKVRIKESFSSTQTRNALVPDFITSSYFEGAWWEVDLRSRYAITRVEVRNRFNCCGERLSNSRVILKDGASPVADYNIGAAYTNELLNIPESSFKKVVSWLNSFGASRQGRDSFTLTYLHLCDTASFREYTRSICCRL